MPLSNEDQALFNHAKQSIPRWLTGGLTSALEWLYSFTEIFSEARAQGQDWVDITLIDNASGSELDQHALDRGTTRRANETDPVLRARLRSIDDQVTEPALISGIDTILDTSGLFAKFRVEKYTTSGWTTSLVANNLTSAGGAQTLLTLTTVNDGTNPPKLTVSGNNSTLHFSAGVTTRLQAETALATSTLFSISSFSGTPAATLVSGDVFTLKPFVLSAMISLRRDRAHLQAVGSATAFFERGYRMSNTNLPMGFIVILPYGTSAATANAVSEYLRQNGPGGFIYLVERRINP